jgi:hypothetical protein
MMSLLDALLVVPATGLLVLAGFFALEIAGAFAPRRRGEESEIHGKIAVLIPAHDEERTLGRLLATLGDAMRAGDRVIVVADNCSDATAEIARVNGAEALTRVDHERRGKGYALQYGLDYLRADPPDVVFIVDADCILAPRALALTCARAGTSGRPAQALYLMRAPANAAPSRRIAAFAWLLINRVRMAGLVRLFDVTRLTGSGMAVPWEIAATLDLSSAEIVEDMALTARLVRDGHLPVLCLDALVESEFPSSETGAVNQRARWEIGSLRLAARTAPGLVWAGLRRGDGRLVGAGLDFAIPPVTVFVVALLAGASAALAMSAMALAFIFVGTFAAWVGFGRDTLPPSALAGAPGFLLAKAKIYGAEGQASARGWTRTERDGGPTQ